MKKVLVITGPTATGKTDLALDLAKKFDGELVACDSRQVYRGLDIGTGKLPSEKSTVKTLKSGWVVDGVMIHMYDVVEPNNQYSVFDYTKDAERVIKDIFKGGKLPIIVGGTGLYLKALVGGLDNLAVPINEGLRSELGELSVEDLQKKLRLLSPTAWNALNESDRKNPRRLLRSIELVNMYPYVSKSKKLRIKSQNWEILKIGLTVPREVLNQKIDSRLDKRIDQGLIEEGKSLLKKGLILERMRQLGLEYGALADLLEGRISTEEFKNRLKTRIHQFAKRQMSWFKKYEQDANWFDITQIDHLERIEKLVKNWYYH